jgi:hypothetical protein
MEIILKNFLFTIVIFSSLKQEYLGIILMPMINEIKHMVRRCALL